MPAAARSYRRYHATHDALKGAVMSAKPKRSLIDRTGWDMERATRAALELRKMVVETVGAEDADLIRDTIEGEADVVDVIRDTVEVMLLALAEAQGIDQHITRMEERRDRMKARADRLKGMVHQAMSIAEIKSLPLDIATLTIKPTQASVIVTDEAEIPAQFWKAKDPVLDKAALAEALRAGPVKGAALSNGGETLQIRSK